LYETVENSGFMSQLKEANMYAPVTNILLDLVEHFKWVSADSNLSLTGFGKQFACILKPLKSQNRL
jgi:hypothetical protein